MARIHEPCDGCPRRKHCGGVCAALAGFAGRTSRRTRRAFQIADERALTEKILNLRDELDSEERRIIDLFYVDQLTQTEIAETLGISQASVSRLLQKMQERVHEVYHDAVRRFTQRARQARRTAQ